MKWANNILFCIIVLVTSFSAHATDHYVYIDSAGYSPSSLTVNSGDSVIWINIDDTWDHTVTSSVGAFNSGAISPGYGYQLTFVTVGTHSYYCAMDGFTGSVTVLAANTPPSVSITSPANNAVFNAPATFFVSATASDSGGSVANVQFLIGTTSLGTDTTSPYSATASSIAEGTYTLYAIATDNQGAKATNSVSIIVNTAPTVSITSPTNNTVYLSPIPAPVTLIATATDSDGTITNVQFLNGNNVLANDTSSPYSYSGSFGVGSYTLLAVASDNRGAKATNSVAIVVNAAPTAKITNPTNGAVFAAPYSGTLTATASDSDGTVTNVVFIVDNINIGNDTTSPYSIGFSNLAAGSHTVKAQAFDNRGISYIDIVDFRVVTNTALTALQPTNGVFRFGAVGGPGQIWIVEASTNLTSWTAIATNGTGTFTFADPASTNLPRRFYRVVSK